MHLLFKRLYKRRYWLALLLPVSCVAGIVPTGSPYIFGAEAYGDFMMGNMHSRTVSPSEVPDLKGENFKPIWCVKWSHSGLDGGTLGYTCGGDVGNSSSIDKSSRAIFVNEEIGVLGAKEGRPIIAISLLEDYDILSAAARAGGKKELEGRMPDGVIYSNQSNGVLPLDLRNWRVWAHQDWDALRIHHDGGFISRTRVGNYAAMWNIYLFMLLLVFGLVDLFRLLTVRR